MKNFEPKSCNIEQYLDQTVEIADIDIDVGDEMTTTSLKLTDGTVVSTTSGVIAKQAAKMKADELPCRAKIVSTKAKKGKFSYYEFAAPDAE